MTFNVDSNNCLIINYFLVYDFLTKYNINNIYQVPKLKKIGFELFSNDILKIHEVNVDKNDIEVQLLSYFLIYILNGTTPFINYSKTRRLNEANFWLKFFLSSSKNKIVFLKNLLLEKRIQQLRLISKEIDNLKYKKNSKDKFIFKVKVFANTFSGVTLLLNKYFSDINSEKFVLELSFFFDKSFLKVYDKFSSNILCNILLMWKNK